MAKKKTKKYLIYGIIGLIILLMIISYILFNKRSPNENIDFIEISCDSHTILVGTYNSFATFDKAGTKTITKFLNIEGVEGIEKFKDNFPQRYEEKCNLIELDVDLGNSALVDYNLKIECNNNLLIDTTTQSLTESIEKTFSCNEGITKMEITNF